MDLKQKINEKKDKFFLQEVKIRLAGAYSDSKNVFFFEDTDDIETYKIWIEKICKEIKYQPVPMKGKDKCLKVYEYFKNQPDYKKSYFFVDNDFDGSKGYEKRNNLFITDRYSIENYLFDPEIIISYLQAEFKCYEPKNVDNLIQLKQLYSHNLNNFLILLQDLNHQIFLARSLNIDVQISENKKIKESINIELEGCSLKKDSNLSNMLNENIHEISISKVNEEVLNQYHDTFNKLSLIKSYRGKFIHFFFIEWLIKLKELHNSANKTIEYFSSGRAKFDPNNIDLYKHANYSLMPVGLEDFLKQVA